MMKSLQNRIKTLESHLPSPEDAEARRRTAFLHDCSDEELRLLECVTAASEHGDDPPVLTEAEERIVAAAMERWRTRYADR
jgi:hypothetical protein